MRKLFRKIRRAIVVSKFTIARGYIWCQTPTMVIIGSAVLKPYFPGLKFYQLALIGLTVFLVVGLMDRYFKFLHEEQSYGTETNTLLMKGLFRDRNK